MAAKFPARTARILLGLFLLPPIASVFAQEAKPPLTAQKSKGVAERMQAEAKKLPPLPAKFLTRLKRIPRTRLLFVAMPSTPPAEAAMTRTTTPPAKPLSSVVPLETACRHSVWYQVQIIYPLLVCHPLIDDIRAATATTAMARTSTPAVSGPATEPENRFRARSSNLGMLVCSYARMPVVADLNRTQKLCNSPNAFAYTMAFGGITLNWDGDPEVRPPGLIEFEPLICRNDVPVSCGGLSQCQPVCGSGLPTPTPTPRGPA